MTEKFKNSTGFQIIKKWMDEKDREPFGFQSETWFKFSNNYSGMVIAPTGFGKTFSVFLAVVIDYMNYPENYKSGMKLLWITPLRALAKDIAKAMSEALEEIGLDWEVAVRNGDTSTKDRAKQTKKMPDILLSRLKVCIYFSLRNNIKNSLKVYNVLLSMNGMNCSVQNEAS